MQEANRYRIEFIREISRYSLIGLLIINILSPFVILFINPEAYLFGQKIAGTPALVYALGLFLITALVMFCLSRKTKGNEVIALVYGVIYFINGYLNVLNISGQSPPVIYWFILTVSVVLSGATFLNASGEPAGKNEKSISTVFVEKPFAGLTVTAGVFLCFVLFSAFNLITYQSETNDCVYQIGIDPETPLYNVTLLIPYPSGISGNTTKAVTRIGESPWYFTNYSASIVETENGTTLRITADSLEKQQNGSSQAPLLLYQNFFVQGPLSPSGSLNHQHMLSPKSTSEPVTCGEEEFQGMSSGQKLSDCARYESGIYATFETDPGSKTSIIVSLDRMRMISSSQSPRRDAFQERITATISGNAKGWYNASGNLRAG